MSKVSISGNASGTGTFTIASPNGNTDRTINLPDSNGTILTTATAGVPIGGPAFFAYQTAAQTISSATLTKVTFDVELFDTNANFASSRFTPTIAGYYMVTGAVFVGASSSSIGVYIRKNNAEYASNFSGALNSNSATALLYLNGSTDYVELFVYFGTGQVTGPSGQQINFQAFLARSAT